VWLGAQFVRPQPPQAPSFGICNYCLCKNQGLELPKEITNKRWFGDTCRHIEQERPSDNLVGVALFRRLAYDVWEGQAGVSGGSSSATVSSGTTRTRDLLSIYKPCDIRGHVPTEITPELYRVWGSALGFQLEPASKIVVGGDVRLSTPGALAALVEGLCSAGLDVVVLGCLPTPMVYYAKRRLAAEACAIVTASHNPPDFNGLKWMIGDRSTTPRDVLAMKQWAQTPKSHRSGHKPSKPRTVDISCDYVAWLQETWADVRTARCHVALDPIHGCWAGRARRYLHAVFPEILFSAIHDTPDPVFQGVVPDCSRSELLEKLGDTIYRDRADLGIAFDGDGDRIALVDNEGMILTAEETTCILLESFGSQLQGRAFVYDLKFSDRVAETARRLGARPIAERCGHTFIRAKMLETGAFFGAEVSGHYFFDELQSGDDALFTACRVIAYLCQSGKTLAELRRACPAVFMTPDLRVPTAAEENDGVVAQVRAAWSQYPQTVIDGLRVDFPDGWALVRRSVTEPVLTFRFEATDWQDLDELVRRYCDALSDLGLSERLWYRYEMAMGCRK